jgi:hypothetical protein
MVGSLREPTLRVPAVQAFSLEWAPLQTPEGGMARFQGKHVAEIATKLFG